MCIWGVMRSVDQAATRARIEKVAQWGMCAAAYRMECNNKRQRELKHESISGLHSLYDFCKRVLPASEL